MYISHFPHFNLTKKARETIGSSKKLNLFTFQKVEQNDTLKTQEELEEPLVPRKN